MAHLIEDLVGQLRSRREALGLSQREIAQRVHMPQSHYSRVESAAVNPRLASFIELARALDLELVLVPRSALSAVEALLEAAKADEEPLGARPQRPAYALDSDDDDVDVDGDDRQHRDEVR